MKNLKPTKGHALIVLATEYTYAVTPDKKYDTQTSGIVFKLHPSEKKEYDYIDGREIFFEEYKDATRAKDGNKTYAFIKLEDIRGYSE